MSDTPRTDALEVLDRPERYKALWDLCAQLERELAEAVEWRPSNIQEIMESEGAIQWILASTRGVAVRVAEGKDMVFMLPALPKPQEGL